MRRQFIDLDNSRAARKAVETLVDQFYSHILEFAKKYLELEEPRDDYRGFLELSAFISHRCSWSCNIQMPVPMHRARWMAKVIYTIIMFLFRVQFKLTTPEQNGIRYTLCLFQFIFDPAWMPAPFPVVVPLNDFRPTV